MEREIIETICSYCKVSPDKVTEDSEFIKDLGLSSFDIIGLIALAEEKFDIEISDFEIMKIRKIGDIAEIIKSKRMRKE